MPAPNCFLRYRTSHTTRKFTSGKSDVYVLVAAARRGFKMVLWPTVVLQWFHSLRQCQWTVETPLSEVQGLHRVPFYLLRFSEYVYLVIITSAPSEKGIKRCSHLSVCLFVLRSSNSIQWKVYSSDLVKFCLVSNSLLLVPPKRRLCDRCGLSVICSLSCSVCKQNDCKSNEQISLKLGVIIGPIPIGITY